MKLPRENFNQAEFRRSRSLRDYGPAFAVQHSPSGRRRATFNLMGDTIENFSRFARLASAALLVIGAPAMAHHSFAAFFDAKKEITLTGTVTAFRFTNPHGTIAFDVKGADGRVVHWRAETNAPVVLVRRGWTRTSLKPGMAITIDGWPSRDGKPYMRLKTARDAKGNLIGTAAFDQTDG